MLDGTKFDSSYDRGNVIDCRVKEVAVNCPHWKKCECTLIQREINDLFEEAIQVVRQQSTKNPTIFAPNQVIRGYFSRAFCANNRF